MKNFYLLLILIIAFTSTATQLQAQNDFKISIQGVLQNADGSIVTNGGHALTFKMYASATVGGAVWTETATVTVVDGIYDHLLGSVTPLTPALFTVRRYIGITIVGGTELSPRIELTYAPYAIHATTATSLAPTYQIGDFAQGGIVFWLDETGHHGLVCAKTDQSSGIRWNAGTNGNTQAKGHGPFAGEMNTAIIIAAHAALGDDGSTYAARLCAELRIMEGGKTYSDWYLPSNGELYLMHVNGGTINTTATNNSGSNFSNDYYWSSTEKNSSGAWFFNFPNGGLGGSFSKASTYRVRAVRAF